MPPRYFPKNPISYEYSEYSNILETYLKGEQKKSSNSKSTVKVSLTEHFTEKGC